MEWVTLIESEEPTRLGKLYTMGDDGTLQKDAVANVTRGTATAIAVRTPDDCAAVLQAASARDNTAIMSVSFSDANREQLKERVPYSLSHIARLEQAGKFPRRLKLGPSRVGWLASEIENWIETCAAARVD